MLFLAILVLFCKCHIVIPPLVNCYFLILPVILDALTILVQKVLFCCTLCYSVLFCVILCCSLILCYSGKKRTQNNRITVIFVKKVTSPDFTRKKHAKPFQTSFSIMITKLQEMSSCYHKKNRDFVHSISIYISSKKS